MTPDEHNELMAAITRAARPMSPWLVAAAVFLGVFWGAVLALLVVL